MKTVVLDSYALLVYFERQTGWEEVANILIEAAAEACRLLLSVINWGEVYYITQRVYDEDKAREVVDVIDLLPVEVVEVTRTQALQAARLKARGGLAYADCFAAGLALQEQAAVMTGDPEFKSVEGEIDVHWLPRR